MSAAAGGGGGGGGNDPQVLEAVFLHCLLNPEEIKEESEPKKRGRPKGSKNKNLWVALRKSKRKNPLKNKPYIPTTKKALLFGALRRRESMAKPK